MNKKIEQLGHIGVLMGGYSSEREISLRSGTAIFKALDESGFHVSPIDIVDKEEEKIISQIREANLGVAFIALHGKLGEDGVIQRILEKLDIPYTGSSPAASQIAIIAGIMYTGACLEAVLLHVCTCNMHSWRCCRSNSFCFCLCCWFIACVSAVACAEA